MTWPASDVDTANVDADTDDPQLARVQIKDLIDKFNQLRNHVSTFAQSFLDDADAAAVRTTLGLGSAAVEPVATFWSTGDIKPTLKAAADAGWVMMNDGSIGNAASGATTRANADTAALFALLWNNVSNTWAVVQDASGTPIARGANAAADYAANRRITLPKALGRALAAAGTGAGLTARALGEALGAETVTLTTANLPASGLSIPGLSIPSLSVGGTAAAQNVIGDAGGSSATSSGIRIDSDLGTAQAISGYTQASGVTGSTGTGTTGGGTTGNMGTGGATNIMSPEFFVNFMVKL